MLAGFFLAVILCAVVIWQISGDARRQIDELATANTDSVQWSLAQAEVEILAMQSEMASAAMSVPDERPDNLAGLRQRYDVFYSRVRTLAEAEVYVDLRATPVGLEAISSAQHYLRWTAPLIDGPDEALVAALPELVAATGTLRSVLRQGSLEGVRVFAAKSDERRRQLAQGLSDLGTIAALLFFGLVLAVVALAILSRISAGQAERNAATRSRLEAVISTSIDAIVVAGPDGRVRDFNEAASRMYGYSADEAIGSDIFDLIVPHDKRHRMGQLLRRVQERPYMPVRIEVIQSSARRRSGELFPIEFSISGAESPEGPVIVAFMRDISRRVAEKAELIEARDRALAGKRAKAQMLAVMSHEMRTPLNGVLGTLDLLKGTALDDTQRRYVEVMEQSGHMLLTHVNNVLDISRADSGNITLAYEPFTPCGLASDVLDTLKGAADKRGNLLAMTVLGDQRGPVMGDPARLTQVLMNLVGNAIKFTQNGRVAVEIDRSFSDGSIEFRVIDTGIGIPAGDLGRIFEEFVTLDSAYNRSAQGTGLGLGIVRRLVVLMGGKISVDSTPGQGSTFRVRLCLPAACPEPDDAAAAVAAGSSGSKIGPLPDLPMARNVLVVEDNATNRMVVGEMLKKRGCCVTEAEDGDEGVRLAQNQPFDLILMDISMPRMDGISATREIRRQGPNADTPVVALTAHALPEDLAHFRQAGMTGTLIKPLSFRQLDEVLTGLPHRDPAGFTAAAANPGPGDAVIVTELQEAVVDPHIFTAQVRLAESLGAERAKSVLRGILAELDEGLARLAALAEQTDGQAALAALAHRLAGSAALIGFSQMHRDLVSLEAEVRRATFLRADSDRRRRQVEALRSLMPDPSAWGA
ncbi:MAG: ATP-binding protein [Paracoccus sp. (in: a-proteobacteria)]|uniref:hybrid sensor histidine kinase/response regulator n=1 Tax=Paracoccus sp. TaxID=267 RepID=UPI00391D11D9